LPAEAAAPPGSAAFLRLIAIFSRFLVSLLSSRAALPKGLLFRELTSLAWPITVSTLSFTVMTVVDTAFVGRLGPAALAGVGLGGIALWTVVCFGFGLLRAVKVLVSQGVGGVSRTREDVLPFLAAGVYVALALSALALAVGFAAANICLVFPRVPRRDAWLMRTFRFACWERPSFS